MLENINEEDFYKLKLVSQDRLAPDGIAAFFLVTFIFGVVMAWVSMGCYISNIYIHNSIWKYILELQLVLLFIHLVTTLFFINLKNDYKFQKFQAIFLTMIFMRTSVDTYLFYFFACKDSHAPAYMVTIGVLFIIGGFVFLIASTIRGIYRVKAGMFRKGGKYLYDFSNSKLYISSPIIYLITLMGGILSRNLSSSNNMLSELLGLIIVLILAVIIQYGMAIAWPEMFLLAYCKFRFPSFIEKMPQQWVKETKRKK